jgi:hypothetical protein
MDNKIVIKEIDKLVSVVSKERVVSEYIIYYMVGDVKVEAHTELGDEAKKIRVNEILLKHFINDTEFSLGDNTYPIEDMMKQQEIIQPFVESVNYLLEKKNSNALAFFLPTKGEEHIECINPMVVPQVDMEKINQLVEDIKKNFSVAAEIEAPDVEITPDTKDCVCDGGECQCKN